MALQVWLPLNGTLENKGLSNVTVTNNGATVDNNGKIGKCYYFNGSNYLIGNGPLSNSTLNFSIAFWVKYDNLSNYHCMYSQRTVAGEGITVWKNGNHIRFDDGSQMWETPYTLTANVWTHITVTRTSSEKKLYVNGELKATNSSGSLRNVSSKFSIGKSSPNNDTTAPTDNNLYGRINDIRIYDHALSAKEVKEISKGLILHYKLDDPYIEGTTNIVRYPTPGSAVGAVGWDQSLHQNAINVSNWSNGYNSGVGTPNKGYHACWKIIDNIPTMYMNDRNSTYVSSHRWLGISGGISGTMIPSNTIYTVSFDAKSDVSNKQMSSGVYYRQSSSGSYAFHDGCPTFTLSTEWKRYSYTYTIKTVDNINSIYFYGYTGSVEGAVFIRNVQVELKNHATPYVGINGTRDDSIIYDSSGYCNHGSITGTLTTNNDSPRYTKGTVFDGSNSIIKGTLQLSNDYKYTASFWVKPTSFELTRWIFAVGNGSDHLFGCYLNGDINTLVGGVVGSSTTVWSAGLLANTLYHIAITSDGTNVKVYKNGTLLGTNTKNGTTTGTTFWIGLRPGAAGLYNYHGILSDFRIYATTLSEDDIKELYNTSAFVTNNGVFAEYELYEDNLSDVKKTGLLETADFYENGAESGYALDTDKTRVASNYIISEEFIEI